MSRSSANHVQVPLPRLRRSLLLLLWSPLILVAAEPAASHARLIERLRAQHAGDELHEELRLTLQDAVRFHGNRIRRFVDKSGIYNRNLHLLLRRQTGAWAEHTVVDLGPKLSERFVLHGIATDGLTLAPDRLHGRIALTSSRREFRKDMHGAIVYHHIPPTQIPVPEWRLGGAHRSRPFTQRYQVDVDLGQPTGWSLRLHLPRGIRLPGRTQSDAQLRERAEHLATAKIEQKRGQGNEDLRVGDAFWQKYRDEQFAQLRRDRERLIAHRFRAVTLSALWNDEGVISAWADAPEYNLAFHRVAVDDLTVGPDHIRGTLRVRYNPDPWVDPPGGGGPQYQNYQFDLELDASRSITAVITSNGAYGSYETPAHGVLAPLHTGSYTGDGPDGPVAGTAYCTRRSILPRLPTLAPTAPTGLLRDFAAGLAFDHDPARPFTEHRRVLEDIFHDPAALLDELAPSLARLADAAVPAPHQAAGPLGHTDIGPYAGPGHPLQPGTGGDQLLAADAPGWMYPTRWRWLAQPQQPQPISVIQPLPTTTEAVTIDGATVPWHDHHGTEPRFLPPAIAAAAERAQHPAFVWYATTEITVAAAGRYLLALPAHHLGACWLDGVLVWHGGERADALDTAVFPVELRAGTHRLVLRAGMRGLTWRGKGATQSIGATKIPFAATGIHLRRAGEPASIEPDGSHPTEVAPLAVKPGARGVPIAWDLLTGDNVRWRLPLPPGAREVVLLEDACAVSGSERLLRIGLADARPHWQATVSGEPLALRVHAGDLLRVTSEGVITRHDGTDGNQRWRVVATPPPVNGELHEAEPLRPRLIGDALVLSWRLRIRPASADAPMRTCIGYRVLAAATGKPRWHLLQPGTVAAMEPMVLRRDDHTTSVWISARGDVVDPEDGSVLHEHVLAVATTGAVPTVVGQQALFAATDYDNWLGGWTSGWKAGIRVWLKDDGTVAARRQWRSRGPSHYPGPAPVVEADLFYINRTNNGHHQEGPAPFSRLHVYDRTTGALISELSPLLDSNTAPKSLDLVAGRLYAADAGGDQYFNQGSRPRMAVVAPGPDPTILAINDLPQGGFKPAFADDCLLVGGEGELICLAVDDDTGLRWQLDTVARRLINAMGPRPIDPRGRETPARPEPLAQRPTTRLPIWSFRRGSVPERMLHVGPIPDSAPETAWLNALCDPLTTARSGLELAGAHHPATDAPANGIRFGGTVWTAYDNSWGYCDSWLINGWPILNDQTRCRSLLLGLVQVRETGLYRMDIGNSYTTVCLAGDRLHDGQVVELRPGYYPLGIAFGIGRIPDFLRDRQLIARVGFSDWLGLDERQRRWRERLRKHRALLAQLRSVLPADSTKRPVIEVLCRSANTPAANGDPGPRR